MCPTAALELLMMVPCELLGLLAGHCRRPYTKDCSLAVTNAPAVTGLSLILASAEVKSRIPLDKGRRTTFPDTKGVSAIYITIDAPSGTTRNCLCSRGGTSTLGFRALSPRRICDRLSNFVRRRYMSLRKQQFTGGYTQSDSNE